MKLGSLIAAFLAIFLFASNLKAQNTAGLSGRIVDEQSLALPGAHVRITGSNRISRSAAADQDGKYLFTGLPAGTYEVTVTYIGFNTGTSSVNVPANHIATLDVKLTSNEMMLNTVTVKGISGGTLRALNQQRNSPRVMNVISAEQVGAFPDPNIGDALKRIPGVYVQYDQGEAKLVSVRGTDPSKSTVSINGAQMPGTGDNRAIPVDAIPADMVQAIELSKTLTPDMDGDAIGGNINLVTRKAPYTTRFSLTGGTGYSFLTSKPQLNGNLIYGDRFVKDKLGVLASASFYTQSLGSNQFNSSWENANVGQETHFIPEFFNVEQTYMDRQRQSYTVGLDYILNDKHSLNFTGIYNDYKDWRSRYTLRIDDLGNSYKENWKKAAGYEDVEIFSDPGDFDDSEATVKVLDENNDGVDDRSGNKYVDFNPLNPTFYPELERHVYAGANSNGGELEHTKIFNGALGGDHIFGKIQVDWNAAWVSTSANRPSDRDFELQSSNDKTVVMDYSNPRFINASSGFSMDNIRQEIQGKNSKEVAVVDTWELDGFKGKELKSTANQGNFGLNFQLPLNEGKYQNTLKFGGRARLMNKERSVIGRVKFKPANDSALPGEMNWAWMWDEFANNMEDVSSGFSNSKYTVGPSVSSKWVGSQNVIPFQTTENWQTVTIYNNEMADGYTASENIYAAYLMSTQKIGEKWNIIAGLRAEKTALDYIGTEYTERADVIENVEVHKNYVSLLPSVHLRYTPKDNLVTRLAFSRTISRPDYRDLVPYVKSDISDPELRFGSPELKPTFSNNFDLLGELYLGSIGILSGGVYYKNIKDFSTTYSWDMPWTEAVTYFPTPAQVASNPNAEPGKIADYKKRYDKAVGKPVASRRPVNGGHANLIGVEVAFQRNLDFIGNSFKNFSIYSNYTHNWIKNKEEGYRLPGTADDILNASLAYESKKINARVSYNYTSDFLTGTGSVVQDDVYYDNVSYLDANVDYYVTKKLTIFATANNLLNETQREYQWKEENTRFNLENGVRVQMGIKFSPLK